MARSPEDRALLRELIENKRAELEQQINPPPKQASGFGGDLANAAIAGVQRMPGMLTGVLDMPVAAVTGRAMVGEGWDEIAKITGFTPGEWADQRMGRYSQGEQQNRQEFDQIYNDPNLNEWQRFGKGIKHFANNPSSAALMGVESLPSSFAGGALSRTLKGAGWAGTTAVSALARAGAGEGLVMGGMSMNEMVDDGVDPRRAAGYAAGITLMGGGIGALGGALTRRAGVMDIDVLLSGANQATRGMGAGTKIAEMSGIKGRLARGALGFGMEGMQEIGQEGMEAAMTNLASGREWSEGVGAASAAGFAAGGAMGGSLNLMQGNTTKPVTNTNPPPTEDQDDVGPMLPPALPPKPSTDTAVTTAQVKYTDLQKIATSEMASAEQKSAALEQMAGLRAELKSMGVSQHVLTESMATKRFDSLKKTIQKLEDKYTKQVEDGSANAVDTLKAISERKSEMAQLTNYANIKPEDAALVEDAAAEAAANDSRKKQPDPLDLTEETADPNSEFKPNPYSEQSTVELQGSYTEALNAAKDTDLSIDERIAAAEELAVLESELTNRGISSKLLTLGGAQAAVTEQQKLIAKLNKQLAASNLQGPRAKAILKSLAQAETDLAAAQNSVATLQAAEQQATADAREEGIDNPAPRQVSPEEQAEIDEISAAIEETLAATTIPSLTEEGQAELNEALDTRVVHANEDGATAKEIAASLNVTNRNALAALDKSSTVGEALAALYAAYTSAKSDKQRAGLRETIEQISGLPWEAIEARFAVVEGFSPTEAVIFEYYLNDVMNNNNSPFLGEDGKTQFADMAKTFGMKRSTAEKLLARIQDKIAGRAGMTADEMRAELQRTGNTVVEESDGPEGPPDLMGMQMDETFTGADGSGIYAEGTLDGLTVTSGKDSTADTIGNEAADKEVKTVAVQDLARDEVQAQKELETLSNLPNAMQRRVELIEANREAYEALANETTVDENGVVTGTKLDEVTSRWESMIGWLPDLVRFEVLATEDIVDFSGALVATSEIIRNWHKRADAPDARDAAIKEALEALKRKVRFINDGYKYEGGKVVRKDKTHEQELRKLIEEFNKLSRRYPEAAASMEADARTVNPQPRPEPTGRLDDGGPDQSAQPEVAAPEAPVEQSAPKLSPPKAPRRMLPEIDLDNDNIIIAVAKLGGLIWSSENIGNEFADELYKTKGFGIMRVFAKTGKNARLMGDMAEKLAELGYLPDGTERTMIDRMNETISGQKNHGSINGAFYERQAEMAAAAYDERQAAAEMGYDDSIEAQLAALAEAAIHHGVDPQIVADIIEMNEGDYTAAYWSLYEEAEYVTNRVLGIEIPTNNEAIADGFEDLGSSENVTDLDAEAIFGPDPDAKPEPVVAPAPDLTADEATLRDNAVEELIDQALEVLTGSGITTDFTIMSNIFRNAASGVISSYSEKFAAAEPSGRPLVLANFKYNIVHAMRAAAAKNNVDTANQLTHLKRAHDIDAVVDAVSERILNAKTAANPMILAGNFTQNSLSREDMLRLYNVTIAANNGGATSAELDVIFDEVLSGYTAEGQRAFPSYENLVRLADNMAKSIMDDSQSLFKNQFNSNSGMKLTNSMDTFGDGTVDLVEVEVVRAAAEGQDVVTALNNLIKSLDPETDMDRISLAMAMADRLSELQEAGVTFNPIVMTHQPDIPYGQVNTRITGSTGITITPYLGVKRKQGGRYVGAGVETMLHEMYHAVTTGMLWIGKLPNQTNTELGMFYREATMLMGEVRAHLNKRLANSHEVPLNRVEQMLARGKTNFLEDVMEFTAWTANNREIQLWLNTVKAPRNPAKTLWQSFVELVGSVLGISVRDDTVLSRVMTLHEKILTSDMDVAAVGKFNINASTDINNSQLWGENNQVVGDSNPMVQSKFNSLAAKLGSPINESAKAVYDWAVNGMAFTYQLTERAVKAGMPSAAVLQEASNRKATHLNSLHLEVQEVAHKLDRLPSELRNTAQAMIMRMTTEQKWGFQPTWVDTPVAVDKDTKAAFDLLPRQAQEAIVAAFEYSDSTWRLKNKLIENSIVSEYDTLIAQTDDTKEIDRLRKDRRAKLREAGHFNNKLAGPYAPLRRYGDYVVIAKSAEFSRREEAKQSLKDLESDPKHFYVEEFETRAEAVAKERDLAAKFGDGSVFAGHKVLAGVHMPAASFQQIQMLRSRFADTFKGDSRSKSTIDRLMVDMYISTLSESSARHSSQKRRNVAGASKEMIRALVSQGRADAHLIAAMQYAPEIAKATNNLRKEAKAKGTTDATMMRTGLLNALLARQMKDLEYDSSMLGKVQSKIMAFNSFWMLASSPSYYMQNATQPWMMSVPVIAGKHGLTKAGAAMTQGTFDAGKLLKESSMQVAADLSKFKGTKLEMRLLQELQLLGRLDFGISAESGHWENTGPVSARVNKVFNHFQMYVRKLEVINRVGTALAAFRLENESLLKDSSLSEQQRFQKAMAYADKIILDTHGDYSDSNAPAALRALPKVMTQFRKFQMIQLSLFARQLKASFSKSATAEERAIARAASMYLFGTHAAFAGALGLPAATMILPILMWATGGDEDDPKDFEVTLRRAVGDNRMADFLLYGAPSIAGVNFSGRIGAGMMLDPVPFADFGLDRGSYDSYATALMGPFISGSLPQALDGVGRIQSGDYVRGVAQLMPKGMRDIVRAYENSQEGVRDRAGRVLIGPDDMSFYDSLFSAIGAPTLTTTRPMQVNRLKIEYEQHFSTRASQLKKDFIKAADANDAGKRQQLRRDWTELQNTRVRLGFSRQPMSELLRAPRTRAREEAQSIGGVRTTDSARGFVEPLVR